jgi:GxxExxY protein
MDEQERDHLNSISSQIIEAAIEIHRALRPGLLESVYRAGLIYELRSSGLPVVAEQIVPIVYKDVAIDGAYRLDLLVEETVHRGVEVCRESITRSHSATALVLAFDR